MGVSCAWRAAVYFKFVLRIDLKKFNVHVKWFFTDKDGVDDDLFTQKFGIGGINHPNWECVCPVHMAAESGNVVCKKSVFNVNVLLCACSSKFWTCHWFI